MWYNTRHPAKTGFLLMYDAIVVGARCAGSPTAMLLARSGHRVLVVDRATFPSDTLSTHFMTPDGVERLRQWGILDRVLATGCPQLHGTQRTLQGMALPPDPNDPLTIAPRRTVLDKVLVDAARESGVEVREGTSVDALIVEDGMVTGIRAHTGDQSFEERARVVIGADGRQSFVARQVGAAEYNVVPGATAGYYAYYAGMEHGSFAELYLGGGQAMFVFPTNDDEVCLGVEFTADRFKEFRNDIEGNMQAAFATAPSLGERTARARRTSRLMGLSSHESFYRKPFGPGWALVGDAGYYRDPLLGQGINDALRDAEALAGALHGVFSGAQEWDSALDAYEKQRNAATGMLYNLTALLCKDLNPSPEVLQMLAAGPPEEVPAA